MKAAILSVLCGLAYSHLVYDVTITKGDREQCIDPIEAPGNFQTKDDAEAFFTALSVCRFNMYNEVINAAEYFQNYQNIYSVDTEFCVEPNALLDQELCVSPGDISDWVVSHADDITLSNVQSLMTTLTTAAGTMKDYINYVSREYTIIAYDNREFLVMHEDNIVFTQEASFEYLDITVPAGTQLVMANMEYVTLNDDGVIVSRKLKIGDYIVRRVEEFILGLDSDTTDTDTDTGGAMVLPVANAPANDVVYSPDEVHVVIGQNAIYSAVVLCVVFAFMVTLCVLACKMCNLGGANTVHKYGKVAFDSSSETEA